MFELIKTDVFSEWLEGLRDRRAIIRILARLERMSSGNLGDCMPVGEGVIEARIHYGAGYRLYFIQRGQALLVLLCGGDKSTQAVDIVHAKQLATELKAQLKEDLS